MQTNLLILAAGLGSRLKPLTDFVPKPLITVNKKPIIESIIESFDTVKLDNIFVVTGYLNEQFNYLPLKYPKVSLIYNELFSSSNNITSVNAFIRKKIISNLFICEGDIYFTNKFEILSKSNNSFYYGFINKQEKNDWGFVVSDDHRINRLEQSPNNNYLMSGVSYFNFTDFSKLSKKIIELIKSNQNNLYWDEAVAQLLHDIDLKLVEIEFGILYEIDTISDYNYLETEMKNYES
jgi:CTP:phosphocholine cytidylyltransferase-like protein